ncbi:MAG: DMT family transporter [Gammaproteobacteria bacterium]|nr:DMT family transporter [Gammaproteobacteria bacterium]
METNNIKAALLVVIAMTMITTNDAIIKHLTQVFEIGQIMFLRGLLVCIFFVVIMRVKKQPVIVKAAFHRWNFIRALLELGATFAFLTGLSMLPLATASTLGFSSPIFLAILAAMLLGEKVSLGLWAIILAGFTGVLIISNPFAESANWAVIFPIACAVLVALRDIAIRYVPNNIPSLHVAFTNAWVVMLGGGLMAIFQGWNHAELSWYLWFFALSFAIFCGYFFYIEGTRLGNLSFVGPFKYVSVLLAILYGYILWGETPTLSMIFGAAIIIFSGILLLAGEKRKATRAERAAPGIE